MGHDGFILLFKFWITCDSHDRWLQKKERRLQQRSRRVESERQLGLAPLGTYCLLRVTLRGGITMYVYIYIHILYSCLISGCFRIWSTVSLQPDDVLQIMFVEIVCCVVCQALLEDGYWRVFVVIIHGRAVIIMFFRKTFCEKRVWRTVWCCSVALLDMTCKCICCPHMPSSSLYSCPWHQVGFGPSIMLVVVLLLLLYVALVLLAEHCPGSFLAASLSQFIAACVLDSRHFSLQLPVSLQGSRTPKSGSREKGSIGGRGYFGLGPRFVAILLAWFWRQAKRGMSPVIAGVHFPPHRFDETF